MQLIVRVGDRQKLVEDTKTIPDGRAHQGLKQHQFV